MKICVLGDHGIDRYHIGKVRGLSAEALVPVVDIIDTFSLPGMAGNVAANVRGLGIEAQQITPGSYANYQSSSQPWPWPFKNRLITTEGEQLARWDESDKVLPYLKADLTPLGFADATIVADYAKGSITPEIISILARTTIPLFVDTKSDPTLWLGSEAWFFPNRVEYEKYRHIYNWLPHVVLTQGADGVAYLEYGKVILSRPSAAHEVRCVNGAGDTVITAFTVAVMSGFGLPEALEISQLAAANVVEQPFLQRTTTWAKIVERGGEKYEKVPRRAGDVTSHSDCRECAYDREVGVRRVLEDVSTSSVRGSNPAGCGDALQIFAAGEQLTFGDEYGFGV